MEYLCTPSVQNDKVVSVNIRASETDGTNRVDTDQNWLIAEEDQKALSSWSQSDLDAVTAAATTHYGWVALLSAQLEVVRAKPKQDKFNF